MSENKKLTHFVVKKAAIPAELNENEKKIRDELLAAAVSLNDLAAAGGSKKTIARRNRAKAYKKRQQKKVKTIRTNETLNVKRKREIGKKPTDSRHEKIEKHWNEKIRLLQPINGPLPLFINQSTKDLEVIRMKQEASSTNALKCKFGKSAIPAEEEQIQQQQAAQDSETILKSKEIAMQSQELRNRLATFNDSLRTITLIGCPNNKISNMVIT